MFIIPTGRVEIMRGILLDREHKHTAYFQSEEAQDVWFNNWVENDGFKLSNFTYIKEEGTLQVVLDVTIGLTYATISKCNYMRFMNASYYYKWFYAFIDKVELVNNSCAKIYFTLDVMQTWLYDVDYTVLPTYVEREHVARDVRGENILPEPVPTGDYVHGFYPYQFQTTQGGSTTVDFNTLKLVVAVNYKVNFTQNGDGSWNATIITNQSESTYFGKNNVSSLNFLAFDNTPEGIRKFSAFMKSIMDGGFTEGIFNIFWFPAIFIQSTGDIPETGSWANFGEDYHLPDIQVVNHTFHDLDGYVPKNQKMFTYPYYCLSLISQNGETDYPFEYFDGTPKFNIYGAISPAATVKIFPARYKNSANLPNYCTISDSIEIGGYPTVPYNNDLAAAFFAQWNAGMAFRQRKYTMLGALSMANGAMSGSGGIEQLKGIASGLL